MKFLKLTMGSIEKRKLDIVELTLKEVKEEIKVMKRCYKKHPKYNLRIHFFKLQEIK